MTKKAKTHDGRKKAEDGGRPIAENRKARYRFEVLETLECGVVLCGSEVKSLRDGKLSLDEAYGRVRDREAWLVGCDIPEYRNATLWNHDPNGRENCCCTGENSGASPTGLTRRG